MWVHPDFTHEPAPKRCPRSLRYALCFFILILASAALFFLFFRFMSQIHVHMALNQIRQEYYGLAVNHLEKAAKYQPSDYSISKKQGEVWFKIASFQGGSKSAYLSIKKSEDYLRQSLQANPLDARTAYALAKTELMLEKLHPRFNPDKASPHDPMKYYQLAIRLRPNGIRYHYGLLYYFEDHGMKNEMLPIVRKLMRIYPYAYHQFKTEAFWSPDIRSACMKGLKDNIKLKHFVKQSHLILSTMMTKDKNWPEAVRHYGEAMKLKTFRNTAGNHIQLGRLFLQNNQFGEAENSFSNALAVSRHPEKDLERLYYLYKREKKSNLFHNFYLRIKDGVFFSYRAEILAARALMDMTEYNKAKEILDKLNRQTPKAEAYYWLARIAEKKHDWDAMELSIQKATLYAPRNGLYHAVFAGVLRKMNKHERAAREAGLAKKYR